MVRRRVPSSDVDDIVQSVLCDALGAGRCPDDPRDVPRWVMAIAKHKVADFHRRRRREEPVPVAVAKPLVPTIEERDLLRAVLEDAERQPSARETIRILIREHEGETLRDIAIGEALSPELVRIDAKDVLSEPATLKDTATADVRHHFLRSPGARME